MSTNDFGSEIETLTEVFVEARSTWTKVYKETKKYHYRLDPEAVMKIFKMIQLSKGYLYILTKPNLPQFQKFIMYSCFCVTISA